MLSLVLTDTISDIILTKNNSEILELKKQYKAHFKQDLEELIEARTFTNFKKILKTALNTNRSEEPANYEMAAYQVSYLREKNRDAFYKILSFDSFAQISAIADLYKNQSGQYLHDVIQNVVFSGWWWNNERRALLTICKEILKIFDAENFFLLFLYFF